MPPWPTTRFFGSFVASRVTWHIASIGFAKGVTGGVSAGTLGAGGPLLVFPAGDAAVEAGDGGGLGEIQGLALGEPFDDVLQDHVYVAGLCQALGHCVLR